VLPLKEGLGPEESIRVHVPLTVNVIEQCIEKLGKYIEDPDKFMAEFQTLILGYDFSWKEGYSVPLGQLLHSYRKEKNYHQSS
jgi:hypothetical protein